jgi:SAM-dependent methyltransferase
MLAARIRAVNLAFPFAALGDMTMVAPAGSQAFAEWCTGPVGQYVLGLERQHLGRVLPDLFGYHLVQVGRVGNGNLTQSSRIHHRLLLWVDTGESPPAGSVIAEPDSLPLAADSIDVIVLPHVLEFAANPHRVLREAERALIGEGHLVLLAFNPWSLWGLWRLALGWRRQTPWSGQFYGVARIRDWLSLLDFELIALERFAFCPPLRRAIARFGWLEHLGGALWPALGGAMLIVARKRVLPLTPIRLRWQSRRTLIAAGAAEPSARRAGP